MWQKNIYKGLFALLFLVFPLGQFFKTDVIVAVIVLYWAIFLKNKSKNLFTKPFLIFFSIAFASLLLSYPKLEIGQFTESSLYLIRLVVYSSLYFVVSDLLKKKIIDKSFFFSGLIFSGLTFAVIGLMQYLLFPDMRIMKYLGWDDHYYRIISSFFDPNFSGVVYACSALLVLRKNKALALIPFFALLLTYSRTSYLAFFSGLILMLVQGHKKIYILPSLIIILLLIINLPRSSGGEGVKLERTSSISGRIDSIKSGMLVFIKNPVLGIGFNTYKFLPGKNTESHSASGVENSYILVLATTGVLGFLAFLNILVRLPRQPEIIAILISALVINSLFFPWIMIWFFLLTAVFKENT